MAFFVVFLYLVCLALSVRRLMQKPLKPAFATATVDIIYFIYFYFRGYLDELNDNDPTEKWSAEMHRSLSFNFLRFLMN